MTEGVVTAAAADSLRRVGELMRDRNVGSVVICEGGRPVGVITDRDLALAVVADEVDAGRRRRRARLAAARHRRGRDGHRGGGGADGAAPHPPPAGDGRRRSWSASSRSTTWRCARATSTRRSRSPPRWPRRRCPSSTSTSGAAERGPRSRPASCARAGAWRRVIQLMAPALDLVLAVGDRVSRIVERDDPEYYPPRVARGSGRRAAAAE